MTPEQALKIKWLADNYAIGQRKHPATLSYELDRKALHDAIDAATDEDK